MHFKVVDMQNLIQSLPPNAQCNRVHNAPEVIQVLLCMTRLARFIKVVYWEDLRHFSPFILMITLCSDLS